MRQKKAYALIERAIATFPEFEVVVPNMEQQVVLKSQNKNDCHRREAKNTDSAKLTCCTSEGGQCTSPSLTKGSEFQLL